MRAKERERERKKERERENEKERKSPSSVLCSSKHSKLHTLTWLFQVLFLGMNARQWMSEWMNESSMWVNHMAQLVTGYTQKAYVKSKKHSGNNHKQWEAGAASSFIHLFPSLISASQSFQEGTLLDTHVYHRGVSGSCHVSLEKTRGELVSLCQFSLKPLLLVPWQGFIKVRLFLVRVRKILVTLAGKLDYPRHGLCVSTRSRGYLPCLGKQ